LAIAVASLPPAVQEKSGLVFATDERREMLSMHCFEATLSNALIANRPRDHEAVRFGRLALYRP
jgi:hypothetical protein